MNSENKYDTIYANYVNGNISDFKKYIKKMSAPKWREFINYISEIYGEENAKQIVKSVSNYTF